MSRAQARLRLFEIARVRALRSRCQPLHRKRESQRHATGPNCLAKSWARSHNFHEAEVKLRAAILFYFPSKDGRPAF